MYLRSKGAQGERELNPLKRVGACNSASGLVGVPLNVVYIENGKSLYESGAVESGSLNARINMCGGPKGIQVGSTLTAAYDTGRMAKFRVDAIAYVSEIEVEDAPGKPIKVEKASKVDEALYEVTRAAATFTGEVSKQGHVCGSNSGLPGVPLELLAITNGKENLESGASNDIKSLNARLSKCGGTKSVDVGTNVQVAFSPNQVAKLSVTDIYPSVEAPSVEETDEVNFETGMTVDEIRIRLKLSDSVQSKNIGLNSELVSYLCITMLFVM